MITIPHVPDLRDLGGHPAGDGRVVRTGQVFRSVDLSRLDEDGRSALAHLELKRVFDLRTRVERESRPDPVLSGVHEVVEDVLGDDSGAAAARLPEILSDPTSPRRSSPTDSGSARTSRRPSAPL
ncbi:tyrosine phosphatase family protein [Brevibacterium sanguinis]|uniref:Tyrosine phosphatase family protein n=2 Tax=Brevibacterium TaxID=1696 RepID=A0A366IHZ0_9MICO|nr:MULTISPECIES: tyrosine-protein phosphatase [Brevibacterium]RBP64236.1 tyrosine phosphatase family protein [Brevibacterium sanguinis]RBP71472.1 tyrosine phosphatase family protein [Brevibacterium celere]